MMIQFVRIKSINLQIKQNILQNYQTKQIKMKRLRDFINQKILPQIRKRRINSYQVFCEFKRILIPRRAINNQYFLSNNQLDFNDEDLLKFFTLLLKKRPQQRSHLQANSILKCFKKLKYFQQLQKQTQIEVVKSLIKSSKIVKVDKKSVIFDQGDEIKNYYILLKGKIGILENSYKSYVNQKMQANILKLIIKNLLLTEAKTPTKRRRRPIMKQSTISTFETQETVFQIHKLEIQQLKIVEQVELQCSFGDSTQNIHLGRNFSAVAMQNSYLLEININTFIKAIKLYNQKKLQKQIELFRKFACFELLKDHQLTKLIQITKIDEKPKNQYLFKQNQLSKQFYLLIQGEVSLNKVAKLCLQNPNKLYANRLMWEQNKDKRNIKLLPFANFENLYNYRPKQELIQLGILGKQNLIGQQQVFLNQPRQTNAKIISTTAKYYAININDLQMVLKQKKYELQDFKDLLFGTSTKKKILYRQDKFSQVLNLKNKKNLDFYLQGQQKEQKGSPRKFQIQKINSKFSNTASTSKKDKQRDESDKPEFTAFNFNNFVNDNQQPQKQKKIEDTSEEKSVIDLTHTTKFIQQQMKFQKVFSRLKNPEKHQINLKNPLFEMNYFTSLNRQYKRLQQQHHKRRFSIKPTSAKKRPNSSHQ